MNTLTKHQIIEHGGKPMFVVVPYEEYLELTEESPESDDDVLLPSEVVDIALSDGKSLIRAWREHRGKTQAEIAAAVGVTRQAYAQMEEKGSKPRRVTLQKIAAALDCDVAQLTE
jgi:DNA-binding XRE family transcriptional regulator